jgi:glucuronokinase
MEGGEKGMRPKGVTGRAFARAGLLGNPSDGYFGRTLSVALREYQATVTLNESPQLRIESDTEGPTVFGDVGHLLESVSRRGYRGPGKLIHAIIKVFHDHCETRGRTLSNRTFSVRCQTTIPRQVGLAGSSAIVTATLRALMSFFDVAISREEQPNVVLSAEVEELGIEAGLQDRVVQVYEGLVFMDFSRDLMEDRGYGQYESLDPSILPRMFVAHRATSSKTSGIALGGLKRRWESGDRETHEVLGRIAELASAGSKALLAGDAATFSTLMNENFDLRRRIMAIGEGDLAMVEAARELGASAKLTGSGGAIIGVLSGDDMAAEVRKRLLFLGARVMEPVWR